MREIWKSKIRDTVALISLVNSGQDFKSSIFLLFDFCDVQEPKQFFMNFETRRDLFSSPLLMTLKSEISVNIILLWGTLNDCNVIDQLTMALGTSMLPRKVKELQCQFRIFDSCHSSSFLTSPLHPCLFTIFQQKPSCCPKHHPNHSSQNLFMLPSPYCKDASHNSKSMLPTSLSDIPLNHQNQFKPLFLCNCQ